MRDDAWIEQRRGLVRIFGAEVRPDKDRAITADVASADQQPVDGVEPAQKDLAQIAVSARKANQQALELRGDVRIAECKHAIGDPLRPRAIRYSVAGRVVCRIEGPDHHSPRVRPHHRAQPRDESRLGHGSGMRCQHRRAECVAPECHCGISTCPPNP